MAESARVELLFPGWQGVHTTGATTKGPSARTPHHPSHTHTGLPSQHSRVVVVYQDRQQTQEKYTEDAHPCMNFNQGCHGNMRLMRLV